MSRVVPPSALLGLLAAWGCDNNQGVAVVNSPPAAVITAPAEGSSVLAGGAVELRGVVSDTNHPVGALQVSWFGGARALCPPGPPGGDGTSLCTAALAEGEGEIRLEVVDPNGAVATDTRALEVVGSTPPTAEITAPGPDQTHYADVAVGLAGVVGDAEDSPATLQAEWTDGEGAALVADATPDAAGLVSGQAFFAEGTHVVRLVVVDSNGDTASDDVTIRVGPENTPPTCALQSPVDGAAGGQGATLILRGTAADADVPATRLQVAWRSDLDGALDVATPNTAGVATGSTGALVTLGTHVITMAVQDEVGGSCEAQALYTVSAAPEITVAAPTVGAVFTNEERIRFQATVSDAEDAPADLRLSWVSDVDGEFSTQGAVSTGEVDFQHLGLSPGTHVVTATVTDSAGLTTSVLRSFSVTDCGATYWYDDTDADGYGDPSARHIGCTGPAGSVSDATDCDDTRFDVNPGADERCDGSTDEDCDGTVDEADAVDATEWFLDGDGDGYGDSSLSAMACEAPSGHAAVGGDCDDGEPLANPGEPEVCGDGFDNDCDGISESCIVTRTLADADALLLGVAAGDGAGSGVAFVGDLDGDGTVDLAVGAGAEATAGTDAGAVYLLDGASLVAGPLSAALDLDTAATATWTGVAAGDEAGRWVGPAGDLDGDGYDDLLVGAPGATGAGGGTGAAYVLRGPATAGGALSGADAVLLGLVSGDLAGQCVAGVGDVDGDGHADVLVGAWGDDTRATNAGAAYLLSGPLTGGVSLGSATARMLGHAASDFAGFRVAGAGDVDGDGLSDLIVGAYAANPGGVNSAGTAYVLLGPLSGDVYLRTADGRIEGAVSQDFVGRSVAGAGDIDGDGLDDVIVGATGVDSAGSQAGAAYLVLGPATGTLDVATHTQATLDGEQGSASAGRSVAAAGDVDGDGFSDLLVGADGEDLTGTDRGAAYVVQGPVTGTHDLGGAYGRAVGSVDGDGAGWSLAGAADLDADGQAELLVGAPGESTNGADAGAAALLLGSGW